MRYLSLWTSITHTQQHKTLDIVTLFHKVGSPASTRAATLLKQVSANSATGATEDQASDHTAQTNPKRPEEFELNITEDPPTPDQVKTILDYVGPSKVSSIIAGATNEKDALRKFVHDSNSFQRPVVRTLLFSSCSGTPTDSGRWWTGTMAGPLPTAASRRFSSCSMP